MELLVGKYTDLEHDDCLFIDEYGNFYWTDSKDTSQRYNEANLEELKEGNAAFPHVVWEEIVKGKS